VFANILARPLKALAPALARRLARGGTLILSGLLPRDVPGVLSSYGAQGLRLERRLDLDGWVALVLRRGGGSPPPVADCQPGALRRKPRPY
jgi:ribosomal protein L11 methyltransferase